MSAPLPIGKAEDSEHAKRARRTSAPAQPAVPPRAHCLPCREDSVALPPPLLTCLPVIRAGVRCPA